MLNINKNNIKLQIWDTVILDLLRRGRRASSPSPEATTETPLERWSVTISPVGRALTTCRDGLSKQRLTATSLCTSSLWETKQIANKSNYCLIQEKSVI